MLQVGNLSETQVQNNAYSLHDHARAARDAAFGPATGPTGSESLAFSERRPARKETGPAHGGVGRRAAFFAAERDASKS